MPNNENIIYLIKDISDCNLIYNRINNLLVFEDTSQDYTMNIGALEQKICTDNLNIKNEGNAQCSSDMYAQGLVGPAGPRGKTGPQGLPGPAGPRGPAGKCKCLNENQIVEVPFNKGLCLNNFDSSDESDDSDFSRLSDSDESNRSSDGSNGSFSKKIKRKLKNKNKNKKKVILPSGSHFLIIFNY